MYNNKEDYDFYFNIIKLKEICDETFFEDENSAVPYREAYLKIIEDGYDKDYAYSRFFENNVYRELGLC